MHTMQLTGAASVGTMPGALAFSHDVFLNVLLIAEWKMIAQCHGQYIIDNPCHANRMGQHYYFALGQQVLKKMHDPTKLGARTTEPYVIK